MYIFSYQRMYGIRGPYAAARCGCDLLIKTSQNGIFEKRVNFPLHQRVVSRRTSSRFLAAECNVSTSAATCFGSTGSVSGGRWAFNAIMNTMRNSLINRRRKYNERTSTSLRLPPRQIRFDSFNQIPAIPQPIASNEQSDLVRRSAQNEFYQEGFVRAR